MQVILEQLQKVLYYAGDFNKNDDQLWDVL